MERLIKDPYFNGTDLDFKKVLKDINIERRRNDLVDIDENLIKFDAQAWIDGYVKAIGARFERRTYDELWYWATLETIAKLKKGTGWDMDELDCLEYVSNYGELVELVTDDDLQVRADELQAEIAGELWKHGARCFGNDWIHGVSVDIDGYYFTFKIEPSGDITIPPKYTPGPEAVELLERIKAEIQRP